MAGEVIFVISAHDEDAEMITMTLESAGFLAFHFSVNDIDTAVAKGVVPALIFYNPDAAGSRGLEVCRKIHQENLLESVPIIVATFFDGPMEPRYTRLYGIADFLKKPVSAVDVIEKTEQILNRKGVPERPEEVFGAEAIAYPHPPDVSEEPSSPEEETPGILEARPSEGEELRPFVAPVSEEPVTPRNRKKWFLALGSLTLVAAGVAAVSLVLLNRAPSAPERPAPPATLPSQAHAPAPDQQGSPQPPAGGTVETQQTPATRITEPKVPSEQAKDAKPAEPRAAGKTYYSVQVGAFKSEPNAQKLAREFQDKGYDVSVKARPERDGTMLFRVLSGSFQDRKEASQAAAKIQARENTKVTIFSSSSPD